MVRAVTDLNEHMKREKFRENLVTGSNSILVMLIVFNVYQHYQLESGPWFSSFSTTSFLRRHLLPLAVSSVLILGIFLEKVQSRYAKVINFGFYLVVSVATCVGVMTSGNAHPAEKGTVIFLLLPLMTVCAALGYLYSSQVTPEER